MKCLLSLFALTLVGCAGTVASFGPARVDVDFNPATASVAVVADSCPVIALIPWLRDQDLVKSFCPEEAPE